MSSEVWLSISTAQMAIWKFIFSVEIESVMDLGKIICNLIKPPQYKSYYVNDYSPPLPLIKSVTRIVTVCSGLYFMFLASASQVSGFRGLCCKFDTISPRFT